MPPLLSDNTIAAIATPPGSGGIAILRISGPEASRVALALFAPRGGPDGSFAFRPRHMHYGQALDQEGHPLDDVLAVSMPAPHSATGEDVVEIHCHGGTGVSTALLEAALAAGARLAGPGEFTRRAFLNGRMDLTQAEAVAELISAPTREGARLAAAKLEGGLARTIAALRASLDALRVQVTLAVDFPDEDAELLPRDSFLRSVRKAHEATDALLAAFERARLWREGALAVLAGKVNAGKSSLLNALLGRSRAIVSEKAGTTRDYIEETLNIKGLPVRLVDTAGLREEGGPFDAVEAGERDENIGAVEAEGIRRTQDLAAEADLLLFVADVRSPLEAEDAAFLLRNESSLRQKRLLLVLNKADTLEGIGNEAVGNMPEGFAAALPKALAEPLRACPSFRVSARSGQGLDRLAAGILEALRAPGSAAPCGDIAPNLRQSQLLRQAGEELREMEKALEAGFPPDILAVPLENAVRLLDEVTGTTDNEALLDRIFSTFCIGK